jgi:rhodanese-related sulfurtransferase
MDDLRFETWLGSIVHPGEAFSLVVKSAEKGEELIERVSRIGYEAQLAAVLVKNSVESGDTQAEEFNPEGLFPGEYVVCDVRNASEAAALPIFENAINIPLHQLRERASELPEGKPILVHCAAGYRSAAGSSILRSAHPRRRVHDLSTAVKEYAQVAK